MSDTTSRDLTQCDHCGKTDDHPKVHVLGAADADTYHHDCLPHAHRQVFVDSSSAAAAIVEACESGVHGDDLLEFIGEQTHTTTTSEA